MPLPPVETGLLLEEFPFARVGEGTRSLVIFPGINDALQDATINPKFTAWFCQSFARHRRVYVISRRHGLPGGYTTRKMADDYARVFERVIGPADVFGVSMGSAIAQHFAAEYPDWVDRLVLGMAGPRLDRRNWGICRRWTELSRERRWRELYLDIIDKTYGASRRAVFEALMPAAEDVFKKVPLAASDFIVSTEACLSYDTTNQLGAIRAHTLVLGGTEDQLMPADGLRELAERIPHAMLRLFEGAGHGVFEQYKEEFDQTVVAFLEGRYTPEQ